MSHKLNRNMSKNEVNIEMTKNDKKYETNETCPYCLKKGKKLKMTDVREKKYWIWLSLIPNLGSKKKQELLKRYGSPEIVYHLEEQELSEVKGIGEKTIKNILDKSIKDSVEKHMEYMTKNNINIISIEDEEYPQILKETYDPPISLYCKGDSSILNQNSIAIVGCREATEYGKSAAKYFGYHLAKQNVNIVSGLAKGVDSYAHIGATCVEMKRNNPPKRESNPHKMINNPQISSYPHVDNCKHCGKAIAVLGNGLDMIYPKENEFLAKQMIEKGGTILSEYPLGTKPDKMNFPARNRIISGMSQGILVIEAKEKSGTLITVDFALEQGRDVFVVPGNINSIHSVGTNRLIQQGAKLVTHYSEIFWE